MQKVVLLGDSIRLLGYGEQVAQRLADVCTVWQPEENCRFVKYMLRMVHECQEQLEDATVVHWNCGLWDVCDLFGDAPFTPEEEYVENVLRIARILQQGGRTVIFATTTPTHPSYLYNAYERTIRYNQLVTPKLLEMGVQINDLFAAMDPHRFDGICEDWIHLNEYGIAICAQQTAQIIRHALLSRA